MKVGISTASLFQRKNCEDALKFLSDNNIDVAEVFLESFCDYTKKFGRDLKKVNKNTKVHSFHVLTTQFEPQLYSLNKRACEDSFKILENVLKCAKIMGAKNYTFHGPARLKKTPIVLNYARLGEITLRIQELCAKYGITLTYENVHWGYYNFVGYFKELKKYCPNLKATLDIKQARQSGVEVFDFIDEMASDINTVHISDVDSTGKMCLPGKGKTDFESLFKKLKSVNFNGAIILEAYPADFTDIEELLQSYNYVKNMAEKIFS